MMEKRIGLKKRLFSAIFIVGSFSWGFFSLGFFSLSGAYGAVSPKISLGIITPLP